MDQLVDLPSLDDPLQVQTLRLLVSLGNPAMCAPYTIRQQIGHFLYVIDRSSSTVRVFNSNRMQLVEHTVPLSAWPLHRGVPSLL